jgi:hypothetical protein
MFAGFPSDGFQYTKGEPTTFRHPKSDEGPTREFCGTCGTHVAARSPKAPDGIIVKVGTLDDPALFDRPQFVVWAQEKQSFHCLQGGIEIFPTVPSSAKAGTTQDTNRKHGS